MIVKEIYVNSSGIAKDFEDRNIPQFAHNNVQIKVYIPASLFEGLDNYAVELSGTQKIGNELILTPVLVLFGGETKSLNGVVYIAFSAILDHRFTDRLCQLRFTPYIKTTTPHDTGGTIEYVIAVQQTFTFMTLNVIKSVEDSFDVSMEEANVITQFETALNNKKLIYTDEFNLDNEETMINYVLTNYSAEFYDGYILVVKRADRNRIFYIDEEQYTLLDSENGKLYSIVKTENGYIKTELTYSATDISSTYATQQALIDMQNEIEQKIIDGEFGIVPMSENEIDAICTPYIL